MEIIEWEININPGPVEEAGQTARGLIDALKAQPAVLALSIAQICMLLFMYYALHAAATFRDTMLKQQFDFAHRVSELLAKCIVPDKTKVGPTIHAQPIGEDAPKPAPSDEPEPPK